MHGSFSWHLDNCSCFDCTRWVRCYLSISM
jgi:hypothetical protein